MALRLSLEITELSHLYYEGLRVALECFLDSSKNIMMVDSDLPTKAFNRCLRTDIITIDKKTKVRYDPSITIFIITM